MLSEAALGLTTQDDLSNHLTLSTHPAYGCPAASGGRHMPNSVERNIE
jgi:hypothetical protein